MIPRDFITEWRQGTPWTQDIQVEQDLVICRALVNIFGHPDLAGRLAFRGGTALYKLHVHPAVRYSEDIDLVQIPAESIGPTIDALRATLDPWLGKPGRTVKEGRVTLLYRLTSEGPPSAPMRLKVEINSREHFTVDGYISIPFDVQSRWFAGQAAVLTYTLEELLATKFRALYQRKKGRDLFDLWYILRHARPEASRIVAIFLKYMEQEGHRVSRAEFEANLAGKADDPAFAADIAPLIAAGVAWGLDAAIAAVREELVARLPGEPWKGGMG